MPEEQSTVRCSRLKAHSWRKLLPFFCFTLFLFLFPPLHSGHGYLRSHGAGWPFRVGIPRPLPGSGPRQGRSGRALAARRHSGCGITVWVWLADQGGHHSRQESGSWSLLGQLHENVICSCLLCPPFSIHNGLKVIFTYYLLYINNTGFFLPPSQSFYLPTSVVDLEWFIPDSDPGTYPDPDPTHII